MLEKLGFKKRTHVGITLSANNFLELVCVDKATKTIVNYASGNVKYNNAIKEIVDFEEFKEVLEALFDEAGLDPTQCAITMTVPNVHFDITSLDSGTDEAMIEDNLQSDIEDMYIFKRNEPRIAYSILPGKASGLQNIVYGAIQQKVVAKFLEIFDGMGADLVRVDSAYPAMLKALEYNEKYAHFFDKEEKTLILLVTQTSCSSFSLNGNIVVEYTEEPLAVKSFSPEEVFTTISKIAETSISNAGPSNFILISETDEVNAELISQRINFSGTIEYINKSIDLNDPFMDVANIDNGVESEANTPFVSIEGVGAAVADFGQYPLDINFLPGERVNGNLVEIGEYEVDFIRFLVVLFAGAILIAFLLSFLIKSLIGMQTTSQTDTNNDRQREIKVFQQKISQNSTKSQEDILKQLTDILDNNKKLTEVYTALSTDIPESIYIKRFVTNENGAMAIIGEATTSESVEKFVNNLREKNNILMLSKLSVNSKFDAVPAKIPNGFTFEITTQDKEINLDQNNNLMQTMPGTIPAIPSGYNVPTQGGMMPPPSPII